MRSTLDQARLLLLAAVLTLDATAAHAQTVIATPYDTTGIYGIRERVGWTITLAPGQQPSAGMYPYVVTENGGNVIRRGALDFSRAPVRIETSLAHPGMVRVEIRPPRDATQPFGTVHTGGPGVVALGAAVAPTRITPVERRPADFDAFWDAQLAQLARVPMNATVTQKESGSADIDYATVRLDNVDGAHVYGQLARPHRDGKFPALLILQYASPPYPLPRQWVTDRAREGWLAFNVEPHDVPSDMPPEFYASLPQMIKEYPKINAADRDHGYFRQMYLGDVRAVDYLASRPDWDGRVLVATGTSMGGQQSLAVAGLDPRITGVVVNVPAGSDANGTLHGHMPGYPNWNMKEARVAAAARYFDITNFAPRIKAPTMMAMGFIDAVTPAIGIWTTFNLIRAPKEAVPMIESPHNHQATPEQQRAWSERSAVWMAAVKAATFPK